jgi:hypothetical protein
MKPVEAGSVLGVQEVPGSNPGSPTKFLKELQPAFLPNLTTGVQLESSLWTPGMFSDFDPFEGFLPQKSRRTKTHWISLISYKPD